MDPLAEFRSLVKKLLLEYERLYNLKPTPGVENSVVFDDERNHFLLVSLGWSEHRRVKRIILHVRLRDDKIWVEEDWTEDGLAADLLHAGVPRDKIVLAFHPPERRPLTEFAVA